MKRAAVTARAPSAGRMGSTSLPGERVIANVGARPWGIALSADGKHLYTANGPSDDLSIIDWSSGQITRVKIGGSPWGVARNSL